MRGKCLQNVLLIAVLLSGLFSRAQNGAFTMEFMESGVETTNTGIIDAYVKIRNTSSSVLKGVFDAHSSHEDLYLVQRKPKSVVLNPRDSIFIPVKAVVSTTASAGNQCNIEAVFETEGGEIKNILLPVLIQERKMVKMFLLESNIIYEKPGDSIVIPIRLSNDGNMPQKVTLLARYPEFVAQDLMESKTFTINAFTDTIISLKKEVNKTILREEDFNITVTALYTNGDIIGTGYIRASSIKQDRRYSMRFDPNYMQTFSQFNQVAATYQYNSSNVASYYLYANAQAEINKSLLHANVDVNWWENSEDIFLRNSWLKFTHQNFGAVAGSLSKFGDINLIGRGVEAFYGTEGENRYEAGYIDKSFNLLDYSGNSIGESAYAFYYHNGGWMQKGFEASLVYDRDNSYKLRNYLASSRFSVINTENFKLKAGGSVSHVYSEESAEGKLGGAAEVLANGRVKEIFYNSSNYLSTGYFAGVRKGVMNLNERINLSLGKYNLWVVFNYLSVMPEPLQSRQFASSEFSTTRYDIGVARRFSAITVSFSPYYYHETRNERIGSGMPSQQYTLNAARLSTSIMYMNSPTRQNVSLTFEGGLFETNLLDSKEFHFKTSINYSWKFFNLLMLYQYNNFYLGEVIATQQSADYEKYYNFSISPAAQLKLLNEKLTLRAGIAYTSNSQVEQIVQYTGRADYNFSKHFSLFVSSFYNTASNNPYDLNTIQAGVIKRFNPIRIDRSKSDLEVYVYYEITGKGPTDPQNPPAANQLIIIDGKAFRTNSNGMVKYRSMPPGTYEVRPVNDNEWHAYRRSILVNQDTRLDIGLSRTATIKGAVSYFSTEKSYDITRRVLGLSVIAIDDTGNVFNTKTDDSGNFVLYVPKGNYTITLEKTGVSEYVEVENNNQQVLAEPNDIREISFKLNIKEKRVETRKFTSRGFPSLPAADDKKKKKK